MLGLLSIFQLTNRKFLLDAAPLVGTAASYGLMKDIIQEGLLSNLEADMWLSSLAFQPKPTIEMITVVAVGYSLLYFAQDYLSHFITF